MTGTRRSWLVDAWLADGSAAALVGVVADALADVDVVVGLVVEGSAPAAVVEPTTIPAMTNAVVATCNERTRELTVFLVRKDRYGIARGLTAIYARNYAHTPKGITFST